MLFNLSHLLGVREDVTLTTVFLLIFGGAPNPVHLPWTLLVFELPFGNSENFLCLVVYAELGLDFHQILQRKLQWVKERVALRWVEMLPPIRSLCDKMNSTLI